MTGETKHVYVINAKEASPKDSDKDPAYEQFSTKETVKSSVGGAADSSESAYGGGADKAAQINGREKEPPNQREAIIRPQQAGKIDFTSLHNRPKFPSDAVWNNSKSSPLSPTGKNRGRDKGKRSGKGDRTQHQLYRLSITNSRSNPTIGIAYPQQKVTPPKKLEVSRGPVSGSYRFHVPNLPEREAELQQEDLSFNRCFQESSPGLTSANYTSQKVPACRTYHGLKLQPQSSNPHETASSNGQLLYLDFPPNGNSWSSSEKNFFGANNYGTANQKLCPFPEGNKTDSHCFGSLQFQYPFQSLQEPNGNSFCNNTSSQDFVDVSLPANQAAHGALSFQPSSREGPEEPQVNGSYGNALPENRTYGLPSQQAPFLHAQQGVQHPPTPPCYTVRNELSADHNGAISFSGAVTSSGAIDPNPSTFQENPPVFIPSEFSLHGNNVPSLVNKRQQPSKDFASSQRLLTPGSTLRRNIPQLSINQVHFPGKVYNSVNAGSVPFNKNISRIPQTCDAGSKTFPTLDQSSVSYNSPPGNLLPYQCQPNADQRQALKNTKMPWPQVQLTSAMPNQNRIELSRQIGNQKLSYPVGNSDWPNNNLLQKVTPGYHNKKHLTVEVVSSQRPEPNRPSYSTTNGVLYDGVKEASSQICDSRNKGILFGMSQPTQQTASSRSNANQTVSGSPSESPLPSPATNPVSGSTCSSLSPMSSSPVNPSSDDNQMPPSFTSSPYFHQACHPTESKTFHLADPINSGSLLYPTPDCLKTFTYLSDASKEDQLFKNLQEHHYQKPSTESGKGCLDGFENEPPPPPPYASHHLLANSLSSANLDQLDVLLTCKQCDQNYNNLSSFLEHRQYCGLNSTLQNEPKDPSHSAEGRKQTVEPIKTSHVLPGLSLTKGPVEFHPHLMGFNKVVDYLLESDVKGDPKEDPMKVNIFQNLISNSVPLTACDTLEMDDAKLDSLITEALNGLEFQVDNPEIDSSFIDVFVDDDVSTSKGIGCGLPYKLKEPTETKKKQKGLDEKNTRHNLFSAICEDNYETDSTLNQRNTTKRPCEHKNAEIGTAHPYCVENEKINLKEIPPKRSEDCKLEEKAEAEKCVDLDQKRNLSTSKGDVVEAKDTKTSDARRSPITDLQEYSTTENQKPRRPCMNDVKKKKSHNGTWSKELIHKIVQQKNKLHKLHVKSNKNVQFSLVTERLFPPAKSHTFGEYDYISDSEDEADLHSKKQPNGRLKYSFNRNHPVRGGRMKEKETVWRMGEATRFQLQSKDLRSSNKEALSRLRRRSSQSSTSSDQSTSISSETGSSPKSIERTDSENEQETMLKHGKLTTSIQNIAMERNLIRPLYKESLSETFLHQTEFARGTKRFGSAKFLLASSKVYPSKMNGSKHVEEHEKLQPSEERTYSKKEDSRDGIERHFCNGDEQEIVKTPQKMMLPNNLSHEKYSLDLLVDVDHIPQKCSSLHEDIMGFQSKQVNGSSCVSIEPNNEVSLDYSEASLKVLKERLCNKAFPMSSGCYNDDSTENPSPGDSHEPYTNEFPTHKDLPDLYTNNLFPKTPKMATSEIEELYLDQDNPKNNDSSFEHKCTEVPNYSTDNDGDKVSSTLSFDSSSIFGELPMSDFEAPLFTNIAPGKDNYAGYTCSNDQPSKPVNFGPQYPPFLQEKNWGLLEGPAMISGNIAPYQMVEDQGPEKYGQQMSTSSGQMSLGLSDSVTDFTAPFINNISEDELEIKRLVTELESQLQTNKLNSDASSEASSEIQISTDLVEATVPFQDMVADSIESCRKNLYLDELSNVNNSVCVEQNIQECRQIGNVDDNCDNLRSPWGCSVQFDTFTSSIHEQSTTLECFTPPLTGNQYQVALNEAQLSEELSSLPNNHSTCSVIPDACLNDFGSQTGCTLITAKTMPSENEEDKKLGQDDATQNDQENLFPKKEKQEEKFDDPPELEPFQSVSELNPKFDSQGNVVPVLNRTTPPLKNDNPQEELCDEGFRAEIPSSALTVEYSGNHLTDGQECSMDSSVSRNLKKKDNVRKRSVALLDMPVLEKEESAITNKSPTNQEPAENPLQQLQLFVARTAKHNEEDMFLPCFPGLLATPSNASSRTEVESDSSLTPENKFAFKEPADIDLDMKVPDDTPKLPEANMISVKNGGTNSAVNFESLNNETQNEGILSHCTSNECVGLGVINIDSSGATQDSNDLMSRSNNPENLYRGQGKMDEQVKDLTDGNKLALTIDKQHIKSTFPSHALEGDTFTSLLKKTSSVPSAMELSSTDANAGYPLPSALALQDNQVSQGGEIDASGFTGPQNQEDDINNLLQEKDVLLTNNENVKKTTSGGQEKADAFVDESSVHFPLHLHHPKDYQTQNQHLDMSIPTSHSSFHWASVPKPNVLCSPTHNILNSEEDITPSTAQKSPLDVSNPRDPPIDTEMLLYLQQDGCLASSLDTSPKPATKGERSMPRVDGSQSPCFCSELVCPHYKPQLTSSVTDIILQCGTLPISDDYPIFAEGQKYSTLSNKLFTDTIQSVNEPPMFCQKDEGLKWDNPEERVHMNHTFPTEDQPTALVSELMEMTESGFVDLNSHQIPLSTDESSTRTSKRCASAENHGSIHEKRATNDMDSIIDGVLRILDRDKEISKEILESIGIPARSSPVKEKKPTETSFMCDICSVQFKSKPGLTRHKAAKHNVKNDGTVISHKDSTVAGNGKHNDNISAISNCDTGEKSPPKAAKLLVPLENPTVEIVNRERNIQTQYYLAEDQQMPPTMKTKEEVKSKEPTDDTSDIEATRKKKFNGKIKKKKMKAVSNKSTSSQVPSDDVLNILKTNILKAIGQSSSFASGEEKVTWTQSSEQETNQKAMSVETYYEDNKGANNILDADLKECLAGNPNLAKEFKESVENTITHICELEPGKRSRHESSVSDVPLKNAPENCYGEHLTATDSTQSEKDIQVSRALKDVEPDLHSLFDDENTFSQLFPSDHRFIRRKCTRVYGKKTKRPTPSFESDFKNIDFVEPNNSSHDKNYASGYGNISVESTLVDHTLPDVEYVHTSPVRAQNDVGDNEMLPLVVQTSENIKAPALIGGNKEEEGGDLSFEDALFKSQVDSCDSFVEMNSTIRDSEIEEAYSCKMNEDASLSEFPTIDMKMLSAKFDMRELSFFSACGDDSDQSDMERAESAPKSERQKKHGKNKMDSRRPSRNRGNLNIKTKEKQYKCKVCFQWFLTLGELDFHKLTHNPSPPPTCYMCVQRKFSSREQLRDHLKDKHAKNKAGLWICGMCLKEISDVWMYNEHLREHATQFARKGQAQKTVMGIPGMVRTFLSTFIYRTPGKSSKISETEDKGLMAKKQDHKDEEELANEKEPESKTYNSPSTSVHVKLSVSPPLETMQKSDHVHKNPAIHPHCKDPSRDCHHCGKQFPKPFKLQRHLVVHSLQKIYLCHKCPKSYQENHELRNHLNNEHKLSEEPEIKHTTLYACELCADVMHVIKKSFICSTCNYTFSKKEQYDRHMEKHLIGGSMTFKFRGVMRPSPVLKEDKEKTNESSTSESMPPCKKQKTFSYSDTPPDITCIDIKHISDHSQSVEPVLSPVVFFDEEVTQNESKQEIIVKTEDVTMGGLEIHRKGKKGQATLTSSTQTSPILHKKVDEVDNGSVDVTAIMNMSDVEIASLAADETEVKDDLLLSSVVFTQDQEPPILYPTNPKYIEATSLHQQVEDQAEISGIVFSERSPEDVLCHLLSEEPAKSLASTKEMSTEKDPTEASGCSQNETISVDKEGTQKSLPLNGAGINHVPGKLRSVPPDVNGSLKDSRGPKKTRLDGQVNTRPAADGDDVAKSCTPKLKAVSETCSLAKDSSVCTLKETTGISHKISKKEPIVYLPKNNCIDSIKLADKASTTSPSKLHPKKRKEHKTSGHKGASASRENLAGEVKKKKANVVGVGKTEIPSNVKRTECISTASTFPDSKEDTPNNRHHPKPHIGAGSGQLKKIVLDTHNQKKANSRASNGDYKCKKLFQAKNIQPFAPKTSASSLNSASQKRKSGPHIKPTEPSNYRTAESQNNLLSQLFGQKLTSFKIPLRRDITE
ncbi:zinc finger protein 469 [Pelodytes ibericus]